MGRLIVFKVGSSTLMGPDGELDVAFVRSMCEQICELKRRGDRVVLVSSGAAAVGRSLLGFTERPSDIPTLQACAAAGQTTLIERYAEVLAQDGVRCAQVLLTRGDVVDRTGYLNARNTFERLLSWRAAHRERERHGVGRADPLRRQRHARCARGLSCRGGA